MLFAANDVIYDNTEWAPHMRQCCSVKPKFHLLRHVKTRQDTAHTTCRVWRDERVALVVRVAPCLFQPGLRRRSSSVRA